jgi:delta-aminolevulinic acid dehydratase/porphobilinogen synthase
MMDGQIAALREGARTRRGFETVPIMALLGGNTPLVLRPLPGGGWRAPSAFGGPAGPYQMEHGQRRDGDEGDSLDVTEGADIIM